MTCLSPLWQGFSPMVNSMPKPFLTPGTLYCGAAPAVISTVLGSCVAVCLIDRHNRAAGMNHFVLPHNPAGEDSLRYGDVALDRLHARMGELGCETKDLRAKVFGGAAVLPFGATGDSVGTKNVKIAIEWLHAQGIPTLARRTGGENGLLIRFYTATGRVLVRTIQSAITIDLGGISPAFDSRQSPFFQE
ncbi:chemotaxis protein CheD [Rhodospirillum rubrum]|nr:chemotaxis protein CheD [Rhodospirillum rubrum]AEO47924.1 CheD [Rhodospirillum rubrum F11]